MVLLFGCVEPHTGVVSEPFFDTGTSDCLVPAIGAIDFGTVTVGERRELTAAWFNECGLQLIITELSVTGESFEIGQANNLLVPPSGTLQVPVAFVPVAEGSVEGELLVEVDRVQVSPSTVPLSGDGYAE
jgi:hypothetical protein